MSINSRLIDLMTSAQCKRIAVIGDIILDSYIQGDTNRISPEAPIQVLDVNNEKKALGGAANVAANLRNLGVEVDICGIIGDDQDGDCLLNMLEEKGIGSSGVIVDPHRPTTNKTRVIAHNQQLVRIDRETKNRLSENTVNSFLMSLSKIVKNSEMVVLSDYGKGVLTSETIKKIISLSKGDVIADPKGVDYTKYRGCRFITPNRKEAEEFTGITISDRSQMKKAADYIFEKVKVKEVIITLGADGIFYSRGADADHLIPVESKTVYDVTGAGDTVIALLAFSIASGIGLDDAVHIANTGAGLVVGKLGVATPTREDMIEAYSRGATQYMDKILTRTAAAEISREIRMRGQKLVFTNGCFDLLHGGHISYFRAAKKFGDCLMVAVNDDESVKRLKGDKRPILSINERMEILASLQVVDYVVSFSEDTPFEIIGSIKPQVLIKGEDWKEKGVVGQDLVEADGGEVKLMPLREGYSTTGVIERILDKYRTNG